jgi:diaminopimelate decarboxylase
LPIKVYALGQDVERRYLKNAHFGGYTCIEGDYLYKGFSGYLGVGDLVIFDDVGSYSIVMKPPFILPNVAILEPDESSNSCKLIKRKEVFADIFHTYIF